MAYAITTQPTPCIYHRQGRCVHGVRCKFSHSQSEEKPSHPVPISHRNDPMAPQHFVAPIVVAGQAICEFYKRGSCKFGDTCHYLHPRSAAGVANAPSSSLRATASAFSPTQSAASAKVAVRDTSSQPFGPCKFFAHGRCTKGTACPFPHPTSVKSTGLPLLQSSEPSPKHRVSVSVRSISPISSLGSCKFFLQGKCAKGESCTFGHPRAQETGRRSNGLSGTGPSIGEIVQVYDTSLPTNETRSLGVRVSDHGTMMREGCAAAADGDKSSNEQVTTRTKSNSKIVYGPGAKIQQIITAFESHCVVLHNLPSATTHTQLIAFAEPIGALQSVIIHPPSDGNSRLSARIQYLDPAHATQAVAQLPQTDALGDVTARLDLRAAESGRAVLRSTKAKLSWFAPSLIAWAHYASLSKAKEQASRLNGMTFDGNTIRASFQTPTRNQTKSFSVELKGLPLNASSIHLKSFARASSVTLGKPNFVIEDAVHELRKLLSSYGPIESFDLARPDTKKPKVVAFVQFADADMAEGAVTALNTSRQAFLRGGRIFLELIHSIKYMLPMRQFAALRAEIDELRDVLQTCKLRYHDKDEHGLNVDRIYVRAYGPDAKALGRLKVELEQLLKGELVLDESSEVVWHEHFSSASGAQFLDSVATETRAYIKCDPRTRTLQLFGNRSGRTAANARILTWLETLRAQEHLLELDQNAFSLMLRGGFQSLQATVGDMVRLDVVRRRIVVQGDDADVHTIREAVTQQLAGALERRVGTSNDADCPVCFCDVTDPVTLPCFHSYCRSCLRHYLGSLGQSTSPTHSIATCLAEIEQDDGSHRACMHAIPLATIRTLLSPGEEDQLLESTFLSYIHGRPQEFRYCPTADCQTIYRASTDGTLLRCPLCLARICSTCHVEFHEGLTCAEFKDNSNGGEDSFRQWREEHGVKACPGCGGGLEKSGGCNHMTCVHCGTHMCWVCMETFKDIDSGAGVYAHMRRAHGGIGI